jgi:hypothetical protein
MNTYVKSVMAVTSLAFAALGCSSGNADSTQSKGLAAKVTSNSAAGVGVVSRIRGERGRTGLLRDDATNQAHAYLVDAFAKNVGLDGTLGVYQLEPVGDPLAQNQARATDLGVQGTTGIAHRGELLQGEVPSVKNPFLVTRGGTREIRVNGLTGAERYVDRSIFHREVESPNSLPDADYVGFALQHLEGVVSNGGRTLDLASLHPYKIRRYMNAVAENAQAPTGEIYQKAAPTVGTYQVAVAFNTAIDDVPVIGPGSKVAVHMTVDGKLAAYESSLRSVKSKIGDVAVSSLVPPAQGRGEVEARLAARGIDISKFRLVQSQFGYLRRGRGSVQEVVAPHYAFLYEPLEGVVGKKLYETVPAVSDPSLRSAIDKDEATDQQRKDSLKDPADRPQHK